METATTNTISVDRVIALQQALDNKATEISNLNREIGAHEAHIETLEAQITELKSKQPEVRVISGKNKETIFGTYFEENLIEYRNLDSVKMDIEKVMEKKYKANIEKLEADLKASKLEVEDKNDAIDKVRKSYDSEISTIRQNYKLKNDEVERNYTKRATDKDLRIKELEEELVKVKEDKTDEQLEKLRTEEIATLKLQIKKLKNQVDEFLGMNIFKRTWLALTNKAVRVAAEKEIQEKERELEANRYEQQRLNNSKRKSGRGIMEQISIGSFGTYYPSFINW